AASGPSEARALAMMAAASAARAAPIAARAVAAAKNGKNRGMKSKTRRGRKGLFPLNGRGRFRADIKDDAGDTAHLIGDAPGNLLQQLIGQARPVRRHGVGAFDNAQSDDMGIIALITENTDRFHRDEDAERLPDLPIPPAGHHLLLQDGVGGAKNGEALGGDRLDDANAQTGAGKGLAPDHQ